MLNRALVVILFFLTFAFARADEDEFNTEQLPIGNPKTKYDFCAVKLDKIFDTNGNVDIALDQLIQSLKKYRIIMLGESHTSEPNHKLQLEVIKGLTESGSSICLALEMFNPSQDPILKNYIQGKLTEEEFLDQSTYFNTWGYNYRYYKPIFDYAREKKIKMFGVNIERDYASKIGRDGIGSLSPEERKNLPPLDTTNVEHRFYFKVAMEGMDATSPVQFSRLYDAQCLWDAAMGDGAIKVARENPKSIVAILVGSGHVAYNLGIGKIIKERSKFPFASVIAVDVPDTMQESVMMKVKKDLKEEKKEDKPDSTTEMEMPSMSVIHGGAIETSPYQIVIRSLADFLVGIREEEQEKYPTFGFSIEEKEGNGFKVKMVFPESLAEEKGLKRGDVILAIDGKTFSDMAQLKKHLNNKNWGDDIDFKILRDDKEMDLNFKIEK
jgi:aminopeptidase N